MNFIKGYLVFSFICLPIVIWLLVNSETIDDYK